MCAFECVHNLRMPFITAVITVLTIPFVNHRFIDRDGEIRPPRPPSTLLVPRIAQVAVQGLQP